ncbi:uncharacterized protein LOC126675142 isoform X2 [Mercurialis annua]|uniref:uncharacterized protein LOC126675142 isoform X2 n=1 Tax=Mercurialis annua TaxID=3986 RepID=UPI00215F3FC4|nr:uncharacterized protein LOC126675142 isoform X2 [Mercurialis annua]
MAVWKSRERSLNDLYNATEVIRKPKITSVLSGSYPMQGPSVVVEDTERDIEKDTLPSQFEKRIGKRSMRRKVHTRVESGTCNVCSTPCSSCMHFKLACMGSKDDGYSDEICRATVTSQNSINEDGVLPFRNRAGDRLQRTTNEASNLISANSIHDSLSENAESKATIRCSDTVDASVDSEMLPKFPVSENIAVDQLSAKPQCMADHKTLENEPSKVVEGHDDNISCVSRANDASISVNFHNKNVDRNNLSCTSVLASSLRPEGSGKALISPKLELSDTPSDDADVGSSLAKVRSRCQSSTKDVIHMEEDVKIDNLKVSSQIYPKIEVEAKKDNEDEQDEKFICANQVEQDEKSIDSAEVPDMKENDSRSVSGNESDESEIVEHDVKVCDICGDAGREDLLAICSKCTDGAEHTYCMRDMLHKLPEGDWLCEECKLAEETEKQKQDAEGKRMNKESRQSSLKRPAETTDVTSTSKRQAVETSFGLPKSSSPTRTGALSRDNSFKGWDKGKAKVAHQTSLANNSNMDILDNARSSIGPRVQTSKSTLLKSNSFSTFNSKPKVKLVDVVPQKQKGSRDLDVKEGPARMISKSMSFRSVNVGRSNAFESKAKMVSSKSCQTQDMKGIKQVKERNAFENKSLCKSDRPPGSSLSTSSNAYVPKVNQKPTPRGEGVLLSSAGNNRDSKGSLSDPKSGSLLRSSSSLARKGAEVSASSGRSLLTNGIGNTSVEQKLNQVSPKEEPSSSSSWIAERPINDVDEHLQECYSRSRESSSQSEKTREVSRARSGLAAGPKNVMCHKCKEIGHVAEFCSVSSRTSSADASAARIAREDVNKSSKLKAAIEAAMLKKPGIFRKKKESDQSDGLSSSNVDVTSDLASHDQSHDLFTVSNRTRINVSDEGRDEGQTKFGCSSSETSKQINSNIVVSVVGKADHALTAKPLSPMILSIPEHDYIWQGALEVRRGGKFIDSYSGIQAHLSTCASPKVLEMANQFPLKISVDEVPRLSTWPRQFHENGAKEDNIAVYFFASDLESYERNYKNLLDYMIKKDFALKASFDDVEFLIFPSTQLPENSQRWNMLNFLWGVFRGRRSSCSDSMKKSIIPSSNAVPMDINIPDKSLTVLNRDRDNEVYSSQTDSHQQNDRLNPKSLLKNAKNSALCSEIGHPSLSQEEVALPECILDTDKPSIQTAGTDSDFNSREEISKDVDTFRLSGDSSCVEVFHTGKQDDVKGIIDEERMVDRMDIDRDEVRVETNLNEYPPSMDEEASAGRDETGKGLDCWQSNSRKRSHLDLSEEAPLMSGSTNKKIPWVDINDTIVDGDSISKKPKTVFHEEYWDSSKRDRTSLSDGFTSQICDLGSSSSVERRGRSCEEPADEKVIHEDLGSAERYFFPVESRRVKDIRMGGNSMPWKDYSLNDENQFHDLVPNLELALGAETKHQNKGIMPFLVGIVERNNPQDKIPENVTEKEEEDVSGSLSLSLSFPFPDSEQTVKPVSKTEQLLPERHHVNTSLLLFGGFADK